MINDNDIFAACRSSLLQPTVNCNIINQWISQSVPIQHSSIRYNDDLIWLMTWQHWLWLWLLPLQVVKLHAKWALQVLMKIFQNHEAANLLKAFLPRDMVASKTVPSTCLAEALDCLKILAHGPESIEDDGFANALQSISSILQRQTLISYHRPLFRVTSMTHYKKFVHLCHERALEKEKLKASAETAKAVDRMVERLQNHGESLNQLLRSGKLSFQTVTSSIEEGWSDWLTTDYWLLTPDSYSWLSSSSDQRYEATT